MTEKMDKKLTLRFFSNLPEHEKKITLSTLITLVRIGLTPVIVISMVLHYWGVAFVLFLIASISDVLDGNLARWRNEQTFLGAALDPVADKLLLVSCFSTLAFVQSPLFAIPQWFVVVVLLKELIIVLGACGIYAYKCDLDIRPTFLGKAATVIQTCFITWLFACYFFSWVPIKTYYTMLGVVLITLFLSLAQYSVVGYRQIKKI